MSFRTTWRRTFAVTGLIALLLSSFAVLANAVASDTMAGMPCCNGVICPMHHMRGLGGTDCTGGPACAMHHGDQPSQALETGPFVLAALLPAFLASVFPAPPAMMLDPIPFRSHLPATPPPRALPS